ncbi:MAG TPA: hypothetical protein VFL14_11710 [Xanthomonadales bacterium]|nr:hypothetical protein [Xanthomonadales bacterium]
MAAGRDRAATVRLAARGAGRRFGRQVDALVRHRRGIIVRPATFATAGTLCARAGLHPEASTGTHEGDAVRRLKAWIPFVLLLPLAGCSPVWLSCFFPSSDDGAARIRAIPKEELPRLYAHMQAEHDELSEGGYRRWGRTRGARPVPDYFARLGVQHGEVGLRNRLVFGGCMDDKAMLHFEGLEREGRRRIVFGPGEFEPSEVLWEGAKR